LLNERALQYMKPFQAGSAVLPNVLINCGIYFLMGTTAGTDDDFAPIKVLVEFDMENRCAETPSVLCGFAVYFCNILGNPFGLILKHTIIHLC